MTRSDVARQIAAGAIVVALGPVMARAQRGGVPPASTLKVSESPAYNVPAGAAGFAKIRGCLPPTAVAH